MTIEYDPVRKRSTHIESGLAVQWVRDEPVMERTTHFKLIVDGREIPFVGCYDHGDDKIDFPLGLTPSEDFRLRLALRELNYNAAWIRGNFDRNLFVKVWQHLLSQGRERYRVSTYYTEYEDITDSLAKTEKWRCEGERPT